jgi:putative cardiolipin synthase
MQTMGTRLFISICVAALLIETALTSGCVQLPGLDRLPPETPIDSADTTLGKVVGPMVEAHPGQSGIYPLFDARDAFATRLFLAQSAERTLDVRYYIWRNDISGSLLLDALRAAADRGVRVRLLLDDFHTADIDRLLVALDAHRNIEVRLFNPFVNRRNRWIDFVTDFARVNRRMHNKSFTADNQVTIVGGRNIGDEYFAAGNGVVFADLDVLAVGPVVNQVADDFERYWTSGSSYPLDKVLPMADDTRSDDVMTSAVGAQRNPEAITYVDAIRNSAFARDWNERHLILLWASARIVSDDPAKGLGQVASEALLFKTLREIIDQSSEQVDVVSPYFVPTRVGADALIALSKRGVKVRVLTNAAEATDVAVVHAGYAKWREELLENGVALYELRRASFNAGRKEGASASGSSSSSLHAKTFSVDHARVFIGSFNFDPRSANLNTEMGLVIESPALADVITAVLNARVPLDAYEVWLSDSGRLQWVERRADSVMMYDAEPGTTVCQRGRIWFMSLLPVEWLL